MSACNLSSQAFKSFKPSSEDEFVTVHGVAKSWTCLSDEQQKQQNFTRNSAEKPSVAPQDRDVCRDPAKVRAWLVPEAGTKVQAWKLRLD